MNNHSSTVKPDPATTRTERSKTDVGSVFVSNYPPYSFWNAEDVAAAHAALNTAARDPFGLYMHIPFCRKRCKFCYFKV